MQPACRTRLPVQTGKDFGHHAGLILTRYLKNAVQKGAEQDKRNLFTAARMALGEKSLRKLYERAIQRWESSLPSDARKVKFKTGLRRIIIGLGGENVTETGLTLHHTYGVPYLPGTALKGVAARYARQVWGASDPSWHPDTVPKTEPNHFRTMFGVTDEGGLVEFLDGWITHTSLKNCLVDEVMTPHHTDYYMADDAKLREPTDFDNPNPVPFLAVRGAFQVAICKRDRRISDEWLDAAQELLVRALAEFGVGGKTNAGYGRLIADAGRKPVPKPDEPPRMEVELEIEEIDAEGNLIVITLDGNLAGTIANPADVPQENCVEEQRLIGYMLSDDDPNNVRFQFVRPAP